MIAEQIGEEALLLDSRPRYPHTRQHRFAPRKTIGQGDLRGLSLAQLFAFFKEVNFALSYIVKALPPFPPAVLDM